MNMESFMNQKVIIPRTRKNRGKSHPISLSGFDYGIEPPPTTKDSVLERHGESDRTSQC